MFEEKLHLIYIELNIFIYKSSSGIKIFFGYNISLFNPIRTDHHFNIIFWVT